jgi:Na+-transporting NADH:ubiquinone oxidoreductase subunit NqrC
MEAKMPELEKTVEELGKLSETATYTKGGQLLNEARRQLGLPVGQGAIDRSAMESMVDNQVLPLLRDTFGAQFTQKEGETLRAALMDVNKSPDERKAILNSFIEQKRLNIQSTQREVQSYNTKDQSKGWAF